MAKRASRKTLSLAGTLSPITIITAPPPPLRLSFLLPPFQSQCQSHPPRKPFTTTPHRPKKSKTLAKQIAQSNPSSSTNTSTSTSTTSDLTVDAFDFTAYDDSIARAHSRLKSEIARIRATVTTSSGGGGASGGAADAIEKIRLPPTSPKASRGGAGDKGSSTIGDVASIIPRGRHILILVSSTEFLRPVTSALQATPIPSLSLSTSPRSSSSTSTFTPQPVPSEPLHLSITIPPVTRETREVAMQAIKEKGEEALFMLREARGVQKKRLRGLKLGGKVGPDEGRRAEREMERRNEEAGRVVGEEVGRGRKGCEGG